jgi:hypothetical protein
MRRAVVSILLFLSWPALAAVAAKCTEVGPAADVIFRARALETQRGDTELEISQVVRGEIPADKIIFKHAQRPPEGLVEDGRQYYTFIPGHVYVVYAKKTASPTVFSQLWGGNYCAESVVETVQPEIVPYNR